MENGSMGNMQTIIAIMRKCCSCGLDKPLSDFYKNKSKPLGHSYECKECAKKYRQANKERIKEYHRKYRKENRDIINAKMKERRKKNPEKKRDESREYYTENKDIILNRLKDWRESNPEKTKTHCKTNYAQKIGAIIQPQKCEECGEITDKLDKHHEDYSKPLDVEWLCKSCHRQLHANQ